MVYGPKNPFKGLACLASRNPFVLWALVMGPSSDFSGLSSMGPSTVHGMQWVCWGPCMKHPCTVTENQRHGMNTEHGSNVDPILEIIAAYSGGHSKILVCEYEIRCP